MIAYLSNAVKAWFILTWWLLASLWRLAKCWTSSCDLFTSEVIEILISLNSISQYYAWKRQGYSASSAQDKQQRLPCQGCAIIIIEALKKLSCNLISLLLLLIGACAAGRASIHEYNYWVFSSHSPPMALIMSLSLSLALSHSLSPASFLKLVRSKGRQNELKWREN